MVFPQHGQSAQWQGNHPNIYYQPKQNYSQLLFQNPLEPPKPTYGYYSQAPGYVNNMNPYPKLAIMAKPPSGFQSIMNSFKSPDGSLDVNKMIDTAGQMMNAVSQVSSVVKGLGGVLKV
ncbi:hypothetical protein CVD19_01210 [Bacillus sp. T33-2]|nr:hypothetical protein CVD19_01210 [Bacillus sp. T33-2]